MNADGQKARAPRAEEDALNRAEETLLVLAAREGDTEAFARLVARFERPLVYYLRRFILEPEAALDAHQEVWVDVFRGLPRLVAPEAFRAWLYRIAHHKAARFVRRQIRREEQAEPLEEIQENSAAGSPESFDAEAVHRGLGLLPPAQRELLTLHYLRDLSLEEIASVLGCPAGTVKSRLHHARAALRVILERNTL